METFLAAQLEIFCGRLECSFLDFNAFKTSNPAADLEFPRGVRQPKRGTLAYYLAKICRKLNGNEKNCRGWGEGSRPKFYYVDPPLKPMV